MNWEKWVAWKEKKYIGVVGFIILYILTIPIRDYGFLDSFINITQGVPIWAHLMIIVIGSIVFLILLTILEMIVKKKLSKKR